MRDLYRAASLLAVDTELRKEVLQRASIGFADRPEFEAGLENAHPRLKRLRLRKQPDVTALRQIGESFAKRGLRPSVYALAEVNRWVLDGGPAFEAVLESFRTEILKTVTPEMLKSPHCLEAIGALIADGQLRELFGKNKEDLRTYRFEITPEEEAILRSTFVPNGQAARFAEEIFRIGWSGTSCLGILIPPKDPKDLLHPNM